MPRGDKPECRWNSKQLPTQRDDKHEGTCKESRLKNSQYRSPNNQSKRQGSKGWSRDDESQAGQPGGRAVQQDAAAAPCVDQQLGVPQALAALEHHVAAEQCAKNERWRQKATQTPGRNENGPSPFAVVVVSKSPHSLQMARELISEWLI
jgi:hypothetical protein